MRSNSAPVLLLILFQLALAEDLSTSTSFFIFPENGENTQISGSSNETLSELGCSKDGKFTIIVHGWLESCQREWIVDLVPNLKEFRGGCIICFDYSNHSTNFNYFHLVRQFKDLKAVLVNRLRLMDEEGFNFEDNGFMFAFSFGGQMGLESALELGEQRFAMIDVCEKAGPGFNERELGDPRKAAKNVQCIHTSLDKGMQARNCHQNWSMGNCGLSQLAAGPYPKGSHGLCPHFYNSAFRNPFYAVPKPFVCRSSNPNNDFPEGYKMGYSESHSSDLQGEFFAETSRRLPYNVVPLNTRQEDVQTTTDALIETTTEADLTTLLPTEPSTDVFSTEPAMEITTLPAMETTTLPAMETTTLPAMETTTLPAEEDWQNEVWDFRFRKLTNDCSSEKSLFGTFMCRISTLF